MCTKQCVVCIKQGKIKENSTLLLQLQTGLECGQLFLGYQEKFK